MQIAYYLTSITDRQVLSTYYVISFYLGHNPEKVGHDLDLKISF